MSKTLVYAETCYLEHTMLALCIVAKKTLSILPSTSIYNLAKSTIEDHFAQENQYGRMMKWVIELSKYDIPNKPHLSLKGQVIVDFIVELPKKWVQTNTTNHWWILHIDDTSSTSGTGVGLILLFPTRKQIK